MTVETQTADTGYVSRVKVQADHSADGERMVVVTAGEDAAIALEDLPAALAYVACVYAAADAVDYNLAVYRQMLARGMSAQSAMDTLTGFLARQVFNIDGTLPLEFVPTFTQEDGQLNASVLVKVNGEPFEHWSPAYARAHSSEVLTTHMNIDLDLIYQRYLVDEANTDVATAASLVGEVKLYHPSIEATNG